VVTLNLDTMEYPGDDDGWRFDPENPPEQWTKSQFERLPIGTIRRLRKPDNGILNKKSQESFDAVFTRWNDDLNAKLTPALTSLKFKIDLPTLKGASSLLLDESIRKSQKNLRYRLDVSNALEDSVAPEEERNPTSEVPDTIVDLSTSAAEFVQQTSTEVENLAVLQSIREVLVGQERAAARGAFFYVLIGLATALAGVATVVTMDTGAERWLTGGITVVLGLAAWGVYAIVGARQKDEEKTKKSAPQ
jgi:hypothetical protein